MENATATTEQKANDLPNCDEPPTIEQDGEAAPETESTQSGAAVEVEEEVIVDQEQAKRDKEAFLAAKRKEIEENVRKALEERKIKEARERQAKIEAKGELWEETTYVHAVYKRLRKEGLSPAEAMAKAREEYEEETEGAYEIERRMEDLMKSKKSPSKKKSKKKKGKKGRGGVGGGNRVEDVVEKTEVIEEGSPSNDKEARLRAKKEVIAQKRKEREERRKQAMFNSLFGF